MSQHHDNERKSISERTRSRVALATCGIVWLAGPQASAQGAVSEILWGPLTWADTHSGICEGNLSLEAGDFWGARFDLAAGALEVSARVQELAQFDPATADLWAEVRELAPPYAVVAGWTAQIDLSDLSGTQWRSVELVPGGALLGTYWVGIRMGPSVPPNTLALHMDPDRKVTWDPVQQRYLEVDGWSYLSFFDVWIATAADPCIRIRQRVGVNICPVASLDSIAPNPALTGEQVAFSGSGTDDGAISGYEWTLADGTLLSTSSQFSKSFSAGAYNIRFRVEDDAGCWSDYQTDTLQVDAPQPPPPPGDPPAVCCLRDDGGGSALGTFIAGLPTAVTNRFSVQVTPGDSEATHVLFQVTNKTDPAFVTRQVDSVTRQGDRWFATFTMSNLAAGTYTVSATAYDAGENASNTVSQTFKILPPPCWWGGSWVETSAPLWDVNARRYTFRGKSPYNPSMSYKVQPTLCLDYLGCLENSAGLNIHVTEDFLTTDSWSYRAEGGVNAKLLGQPIVEQPFDIAHSNDRYNWSWNSGTLLDYSTNLYDGTLWTGWAGPVYFEIHLTVDFGMEADLTVSGDIDSCLKAENICITPGLTGTVTFDAAADFFFGLATLGVVGQPSVGYDLPMCYSFVNGVYVPGPCITFIMTVHGYVKVLWGIGEWNSGDYELVNTSWGSGCGSGRASDRQIQPPASPLQSPRIASDGNGNAICVWIHDANGGVAPADPDVYYSYYSAAGGQWSQPQAVAVTGLYETDPRVVFVNNGQALLVVTQNELTQAQALALQPVGGFNELEAGLANQEMVSYFYDGAQGQWFNMGPVLDDPAGVMNGARGDGRCELAAGPGGTAMAVWVRDPDGQLPDDVGEGSDTDIWAARWLGAGWGPAQALAAGASGYVQPDVAYDAAGNAIAVWVRDNDADFWTNNDRVIEYAYFNGGAGVWSPAMAALPSAGLEGQLWPTVCFDITNQPVIVFTVRGAEPALPSGNDYGEGVFDYLFSVSSTPGGVYPFAFDRIQPVGGPYQNRARWPRLTVGNTPQGPMAFVGCRSFKGTGADGYDGEVGITLKTLDATSPASSTDWFPSPAHMTSDRALDWQIDLDADNARGILRAVWIKPSNNNPGAPFGAQWGQGFDSIQMLEIPLGPDLSVNPQEIRASIPYPQEGENVTITAYVRNTGMMDIYGPVDVHMYLDSVAPQNLVGVTTLQVSGYRQMHPVSFPGMADGIPHDLIVVADATDVVGETNEGNNMASIRLVPVTPPDDLQIVADVSSQSLALNWLDPQVADPARPETAEYRVYRDTGSGFTMVAQTLSTSFVDSGIASATYQVTAVASGTATMAESLPAGPVSASIPAFGDGNGDGVIDLIDHPTFTDCLGGPTSGPASVACEVMDFDTNNSVDLGDYASFQRVIYSQ
ncbi:MAG: PKD domain-containing protein [Phycisphaerae bacterium]